jgi:hypothetical protein
MKRDFPAEADANDTRWQTSPETQGFRQKSGGGNVNRDLETFVPFAYKRRGVQRLAQTATPAHDTTFLVGLGRAFYWQSLLDTGVMASDHSQCRSGRRQHQMS